MTTKADSFAHRLKAHREAAGFTLAELAERAGISKTYLWELEKDEAGEKSPSVDVAKKIAAALSIGLLDLVGDDDRAVLREQLIRRACKAMGWEYKTSPVWTGLRKVALAEAVPIGLDRLEEMLCLLESSGDAAKKIHMVLALTDTGSEEFKKAFPPTSYDGILPPGWRVMGKIREILLDG